MEDGFPLGDSRGYQRNDLLETFVISGGTQLDERGGGAKRMGTAVLD